MSLGLTLMFQHGKKKSTVTISCQMLSWPPQGVCACLRVCVILLLTYFRLHTLKLLPPAERTLQTCEAKPLISFTERVCEQVAVWLPKNSSAADRQREISFCQRRLRGGRGSNGIAAFSYLFVELVVSHVVLGIKRLLGHQHVLPLPDLHRRFRNAAAQKLAEKPGHQPQ